MPKLSVLIALEGAAEIERQLEGLGETGKKAFQELSAAAEQVGGFSQLDPTEVTEKLKVMGITGVDAVNQIQSAVEQAGNLEGLVQGVSNLEKGFGALGKVIRPLGGEIRKVQAAFTAVYATVGPFGVAGVAAFAAISTAVTAAAKATIAFADTVNKVNNTAITLGGRGGVEELDRFRAGLEQAGVSAESLGQILQSKLATEQGVEGLDAFISSLSRMPDSAARSKAAVEQFGAAGAELIRILQAGGRLTGFGGTQGLIKAEDAQKATQLGQAINQLESAIARLNTLGFAPALTAGINVATSAVSLLGQRLEATPWGTFLNCAQLVFNPIQGLARLVESAITQMWTNAGTGSQQAAEQVQQGVQIWTQWGTAAQQAGQQATVAVTQAGTAAQASGQTAQQGVQIWTQWGTAATMAGGQAGQAMDAAAQAASKPIPTQSWTDWANSIGATIDRLLGKLSALAREAGRVLGGGGGGGGGAPGMAGGGLLGGRGTGTSDSNLAWLSRGEYIMPAGAVRQPGVLSFLEALRRSGRIPGFAAGGAVGGQASSLIIAPVLGRLAKQLTDASNAIFSIMDSYMGAVAGFVDTAKGMDSSIAGVQQAILKVADELAAMENAIRVKGGNARGGLLGGRGTGTSDSNLAWVSRGEHIMPARAVAQPGVLMFLEALRRSGGNLSRVLDGMGRFALGGMVPRMPAYAGGGMVGGHLGTLTLGLPSGGSVSVRASSSAVDQLRKEAALAQVRSGGRKPSRYS